MSWISMQPGQPDSWCCVPGHFHTGIIQDEIFSDFNLGKLWCRPAEPKANENLDVPRILLSASLNISRGTSWHKEAVMQIFIITLQFCISDSSSCCSYLHLQYGLYTLSGGDAWVKKKKTKNRKFKTKISYRLFSFTSYEQPTFKLIFFEANMTCSSAAI